MRVSKNSYVKEVFFLFKIIIQYNGCFLRKLKTYYLYWSFELLSLTCNPASYTTHVLCVNFIHKWRDLQFKIEKLFMGILFTLRVLAWRLLSGSRWGIFFIFPKYTKKVIQISVIFFPISLREWDFQRIRM